MNREITRHVNWKKFSQNVHSRFNQSSSALRFFLFRLFPDFTVWKIIDILPPQEIRQLLCCTCSWPPGHSFLSSALFFPIKTTRTIATTATHSPTVPTCPCVLVLAILCQNNNNNINKKQQHPHLPTIPTCPWSGGRRLLSEGPAPSGTAPQSRATAAIILLLKI